jgi:hypothetical protein
MCLVGLMPAFTTMFIECSRSLSTVGYRLHAFLCV